MEIRRGWKTTEFWLSLVAVLLGAFLSSGILSDGSMGSRILGMASTVMAAFGYSLSRGLVKSGRVKDEEAK